MQIVDGARLWKVESEKLGDLKGLGEEGRTEAARFIREAGNGALNASFYEMALCKYRKALRYLEEIPAGVFLLVLVLLPRRFSSCCLRVSLLCLTAL